MTSIRFSSNVLLNSALPATLSVAMLLGTVGCQKAAPPAAETQQQQGANATNQQPQMYPNANSSGSTAASQSSSSAPAAAPATAPVPAAAPAPPPVPQPVTYTARVGRSFRIRLNQTISDKTSDVGTPFSAELSADLTDGKGNVIFAHGTPVSGTVVASKGRGRFKGAGILAIEVNRIGRQEVSTSVYQVVVKGKGKRSAGFIGGGAGLGALLGGIAGGGRGAGIGALAGAGAGTAGAGLTGNKEIAIPAESVITFQLKSAVSVTR